MDRLKELKRGAAAPDDVSITIDPAHNADNDRGRKCAYIYPVFLRR